jgi:hypothetical protein
MAALNNCEDVPGNVLADLYIEAANEGYKTCTPQFARERHMKQTPAWKQREAVRDEKRRRELMVGANSTGSAEVWHPPPIADQMANLELRLRRVQELMPAFESDTFCSEVIDLGVVCDGESFAEHGERIQEKLWDVSRRVIQAIEDALSEDDRKALNQVFRRWYPSGLPTREAVRRAGVEILVSHYRIPSFEINSSDLCESPKMDIDF